MATARNEGLDVASEFMQVSELTGSRKQGVPGRIDYRLTRPAAYLLAMNGDPNKPEVAAAQMYFAVQTRKAETTAATAPALPQDYEQALVALLSKVRENKALESKVAELEPAATSWNVLASGDGDFSVGDAAKILSRDPQIQTGERRLFTVLAEQRWTYRQIGDGRPRAMQTAIECGRLSELPQSHYHPRTGELVLDSPQVRVTVKGVHELHKRLGGIAAVQVPAASAHGGAA
jgi:phage antirepressor YoqD-like protein